MEKKIRVLHLIKATVNQSSRPGLESSVKNHQEGSWEKEELEAQKLRSGDGAFHFVLTNPLLPP